MTQLTASASKIRKLLMIDMLHRFFYESRKHLYNILPFREVLSWINRIWKINIKTKNLSVTGCSMVHISIIKKLRHNENKDWQHIWTSSMLVTWRQSNSFGTQQGKEWPWKGCSRVELGGAVSLRKRRDHSNNDLENNRKKKLVTNFVEILYRPLKYLELHSYLWRKSMYNTCICIIDRNKARYRRKSPMIISQSFE